MIPPSRDKNKVSVIQTHSHIYVRTRIKTCPIQVLKVKDNGKHRALTKFRNAWENYSFALSLYFDLLGGILLIYFAQEISTQQWCNDRERSSCSIRFNYTVKKIMCKITTIIIINFGTHYSARKNVCSFLDAQLLYSIIVFSLIVTILRKEWARTWSNFIQWLWISFPDENMCNLCRRSYFINFY